MGGFSSPTDAISMRKVVLAAAPPNAGALEQSRDACQEPVHLRQETPQQTHTWVEE